MGVLMAEKSKKKSSLKNAAKKPAEKMKRGLFRNLVALLIVLLAVLAYLVYIKYFRETPQPIALPDGSMQVHFIDVGQGDTTLLCVADEESDRPFTVLIDAGLGDGKAADYLKKLEITVIDYLVFTHYDADHIGGGCEVLALTEVKNILAPAHEPSNQTQTKLKQAMEDEGAVLLTPKQGATYAVGDMQMNVLSDDTIVANGSNDDSIILLCRFGETTFLFSGDAEKKREQMTVDAWQSLAGVDMLDADVFQAGHHGAANASNDFFLAKVTPSIVVISCGVGNKYGHPREEALARFALYTDKIYRTDTMGTVIITSDGKDETLKVETEKPQEETRAYLLPYAWFGVAKPHFTRLKAG